MRTVHSDDDRAKLAGRVQQLTAESRPQWGRFDLPEMLAHLNDAIRMATGELPVRERRTPLRWFPLKQLIIYVLPFPKGAPTAPELLARAPAHWELERDALVASLERFARLDQQRAWPSHPVFGALDARGWGALVYKHCDHHLRQFGL